MLLLRERHRGVPVLVAQLTSMRLAERGPDSLQDVHKAYS